MSRRYSSPGESGKEHEDTLRSINTLAFMQEAGAGDQAEMATGYWIDFLMDICVCLDSSSEMP
jgi:hypothetical protein